MNIICFSIRTISNSIWKELFELLWDVDITLVQLNKYVKKDMVWMTINHNPKNSNDPKKTKHRITLKASPWAMRVTSNRCPFDLRLWRPERRAVGCEGDSKAELFIGLPRPTRTHSLSRISLNSSSITFQYIN